MVAPVRSERHRRDPGSASGAGTIPIRFSNRPENQRGKSKEPAPDFRSLPHGDAPGGWEKPSSSQQEVRAKAAPVKHPAERAKEAPDPSGGAGGGQEAEGIPAGRFPHHPW